MVDQRRISISPLTGGIRKQELVLNTWWNYFYLWLNFHLKTTGGSKIRMTDAPLSKNISKSTDHYFALVYNSKLVILGIITISGCLGTLQDRWNFWTFGSKVYIYIKTNIIETNTYKTKYLQGHKVNLTVRYIVNLTVRHK